MVHRITSEESIAIQTEYKKNYPPFVPFSLSNEEKTRLAEKFYNLLTTQNGMDTDDYSVGDNNKVEKYLGKFDKGKHMLLLGVGTGREVLVAKDIGFEKVVGATFGSRNVHFAKEYLGLSDEEILECANEVLPFQNKSFDIVAAFQTFEHTVAPLLFLLEMRRVLRPGGILLLEWPPAHMFSLGENPHHQVCFTPGQAKALFQKAGFGNIQLYSSDKNVIEEKDYWRGDLPYDMCIEGTKAYSGQEYIRRSEIL